MSIPIRSVRQIGSSGLLLVGGVLVLVGNALHPHTPDADEAATLAALAADATWPWIHLAIIVGILLVIGGLVLIATELTGPLAEALAAVAVAAGLVGGAVVTVSTAVDGFAMKALADGLASMPPAEATPALLAATAVKTMDFGVWSIGMLILFGASFGTFGLAMTASRRFPFWYAVPCVVGAVLSGTAALLQIADGGESQAAETMFLVGSMLLTLWVFLVGIRLWRGLPVPAASAAATRTAVEGLGVTR